MTTIDSRVVGLGFDNKEFESGVKESLQSLKNLSKGLDIKDPGKSFSAISNAVRNVNLGDISDQLANISSKFSAAGVIGFSVISGLTNAAMGLAASLANAAQSALFKPALEGLTEYETKINAVQTIMANTRTKGTTLDEVNAALEKLNLYADKTIYNFPQMAKNIGTFTAAGVALEPAVAAIKGIANLAAVSGSNADQASTAMYQLSQAMSSGTVKLMDWNSVVNAGMGGQVFQDALMRTAKVHGVAVDTYIKQDGSFRETLQRGWLTSKILTDTLSTFTGDLTREQLKAMGTAKGAQQQYVLFNKEQLKSLAFTQEQLKAMNMNETTSAAIAANYTQEQMKRFGLSAGQLELIAKYSKEGAAYMKEAQASGAGFSEQQIDEMVAMGESANDAATKVKTLTQLLSTMGESISGGWAMTWQYIIGDFEQAKSLYTEIGSELGNVIGASTEARNSVIKGWNDLGGRNALIGALRASFAGVMNIAKAFGEVLATIFPPITAGKLYDMSVKLMQMAYAFKGATENAGPLKRIFLGIAAIFQIFGLAISAVVDAIVKLVNQLTGGLATGFDLSAEGIINFLAGIGDTIVGFKEMLKSTNYFGNAITNIGNFLIEINNALYSFGQTMIPILQKVNDFLYKMRIEIGDFLISLSPVFGTIFGLFDRLTQKITRIFNNPSSAQREFANSFQTITTKVNELYVSLKPTFDAIGGFFERVGKEAKSLADSLKPSLDRIKQTFTDTFSKKTTDGLNMDVMLGSAEKASGFVAFGEKIGGVFDWLGKVFTSFGNIFANIWKEIGPGLNELGDNILKKLGGIESTDMSRAFSVGILAGLFLAIKKFLDNMMTGPIGGVTKVLDGVKQSMEAWQQSLKADMLMKIATAIAILVASLILLSFVDPGKLLMATGAISFMFIGLMGSMKAIDTMGGFSMYKQDIASQLLSLAGAILIMSVAVKIMSSIDPVDLAKGIIAIGVLLTEIGIFMKMTQIQGASRSSVTGIMALALALVFLTVPVKIMGSMKLEELAKGIIAIGVLLGMLGVFMNKTGNAKNVIRTAISIGILAGAMIILSIALKALGNLTLEEGIKGLLAMGISLGLFVVAMRNIKDSSVIKIAVSFTILAVALLIMSVALKALGNLSWDEIAKGLTAMAGALVLMTIAIENVKISGAISTGFAMLLIAGAMVIMAEALKSLGSMPFPVIAQGLIAMGLALGMMAIALNVVSKPGVLAGAAAILVVSVALAVLVPVLLSLGSAPWQVIVTGLLALAGIFFVIGLAAVILTPVIPMITALGIAIAIFALSLLGIAVAVAIFAGAIATLGAMSAGIVTIMSAMVLGIVAALTLFTTKIAEAAPLLREALITIFLEIGRGLTTIIVILLVIAGEVITALLKFLLDKAPELIAAGFGLLFGLLTGIKDNIYRLTAVVGEIIIEFLRALDSKLPEIVLAAYKLIKTFIGALWEAIVADLEKLGKMGLDIGGKIMSGLIGGIVEKFEEVKKAIWTVIGGAIDWIKAFLGIKSPSKLFAGIGENTMQGLVVGILATGNSVKSATGEIGNKAVSGLNGAMSQISDAINLDINTAPTIRPVVDLTDVIAGGQQIDKLISGQSINVSGTMSRVASITAGMQTPTAVSGQLPNPSSQSGGVSFVQNNYSPTALSRFEIYRQTRNQLELVKGLAGNK